MYTRAFVKNLILPSISVGVVRAEGKEDECDNTRKLVRPRDLALYVDPPKCVTCSNTVESEDGFLLTTIRCARQELQSVLEQAKIIQAEASSMLDNIKKETSDAVSYLQQEENLLPRIGAIGFGAFAGYILAVRKGILKKMLYSAAGAGAIAAIAYPNEAREYSEEVICELKKYAVIGYHFVNGADVDWKKLNEKNRCFEKNGNTGGLIEAGPRGKPGEVTHKSADQKSPKQPVSQEKPNVQVKSGGDAKLGNTSEGPRIGNQSDGVRARSPQTGPGNAADVRRSNSEPCPTPPEAQLPQERPKNTSEPRQYESYTDECKAKLACAKQRSNSSTRSGMQSASSPNAQNERVSGDGRVKTGVDANRQSNGVNASAQRPYTAGGRTSAPKQPPDSQEACIVGSSSNTRKKSTDPNPSTDFDSQTEHQFGRLRPWNARQSQTESKQSLDAQDACILGSSGKAQEQSAYPNPSADSNRPRTEPHCGRRRPWDAQNNDSAACSFPEGNSQRPRCSEPGAAAVDPKKQGSYASRPKSTGSNEETPCPRSNSPQAWPSPPHYRPHEIPERPSANQQRPQSAGQSVCRLRPFSNERPQSQSSPETSQRPQSRDSLPNGRQSADEGGFQSFRGDCKGGLCMRRSKPKSVKAECQVSSET